MVPSPDDGCAKVPSAGYALVLIIVTCCTSRTVVFILLRVLLLLLIQYELVVWKLSIQLYYSSYLLCIVFILSSRSMQTVRIILLLL